MKKAEVTLEIIMEELKDIKEQVQKLVLLIPEESIKEYKNVAQIRKAAKHTHHFLAGTD